jgi:hypothetical protein
MRIEVLAVRHAVEARRLLSRLSLRRLHDA